MTSKLELLRGYRLLVISFLGFAVLCVWQLGPFLIQSVRFFQITKTCRDQFFRQVDLTTPTEQSFSVCSSRLHSWLTSIHNSFVLQPLAIAAIKQYYPLSSEKIATLLSTAPTDLETVQSQLLSGKTEYAVLLQNADELRATGGFPGTFAILTTQHGQLENVAIYDIFAPAGSTQKYYPPPNGVREYLSGGESWKISDANWSPDFPSSAQTVLSFLSDAGWTKLDGVIAMNSSVLEKILVVTGPIWLADYNQEVTAENVRLIARADRETFFPGSYQKPQFIRALSTQLRLKIASLSPAQQKQLFQALLDSLITKDILVFSRNPELQTVWTHFGVDGMWSPPSGSFALGWIESNVGINKANRGITRTLTLEQKPAWVELTAVFTNTNSPPDQKLIDQLSSAEATPAAQSRTGHYVNYQRLWLPEQAIVTAIKQGEKNLASWDSQFVTTPNGQRVLEIGWLITVAEQTSQTVQVTIQMDSVLDWQTQPLFFWKQPGLPVTSLRLISPGKNIQHQLSTDLLLSW